MTTLLFDLETNGLLKEVHTIHCMVVRDVESTQKEVYHDHPDIRRDGTVEDGIERLKQAKYLAGHGVLAYDLPVLRKLHKFVWDNQFVRDTLVMSRLVYSDRKERDWQLVKEGRLPKSQVGRHGLAAWGHRLGDHKIEWTGGFEKFSEDMLVYCEQDVDLNVRLYKVLMARVPDFSAGGLTALEVEHMFAGQLEAQQARGVRFDAQAADNLLKRLVAREAELLEEIKAAFPPEVVPYKANKRTGHIAQRLCPYRGEKFPNKLKFFNPGSRPQLAARLRAKYEWVPKELTAKGNPVMTERVLHDLSKVYPEVGIVSEYMIVAARKGVLSAGQSSYFNLLEGGRIHGTTKHIGTVTHRCAHTNPNLGNVVAVDKPYGRDMRALFLPPPGMIQAGQDADGLELRMLGHYLGAWDGGAYARSVDTGDKALGTDPHSLHARAISTVVECSRERGKPGTYAYLYGAGDAKLGAIYGQGYKLGKKIRQALAENIPGLGQLQEALKQACARGYITSLDGRRVGIRHEHAALNSLLQSAGAVVMRWVPVFIEKFFEQVGGRYGVDYVQTGHIHDETQGGLNPEFKDKFEYAVHEAYKYVGEILNLRVPLKGTVKFGNNWAETH